MKNIVLAVLLSLTTAGAAFFGFGYYQEKSARELATRQAQTDQSDATRRHAAALGQAAEGVEAARLAAQSAKNAATTMQRELETLRAELASTRTALAQSQEEAVRTAAESARALSEQKKLTTDSLAIADQHARDAAARADAQFAAVRELLIQDQQQAVAAAQTARLREADDSRTMALLRQQVQEARFAAAQNNRTAADELVLLRRQLEESRLRDTQTNNTLTQLRRQIDNAKTKADADALEIKRLNQQIADLKKSLPKTPVVDPPTPGLVPR